MYKFIALLLLTCSFTFQQGPSDVQPRIIYKVLVNDAWVEQELEKEPEFKGGEMEMQKFIARTLRYPATAQRAGISGIIWIRAEVTEDGRLINEVIEKDLGGGMGEESLRVIKMIPDEWTPATTNGEPIRVQLSIPIRFAIMNR